MASTAPLEVKVIYDASRRGGRPSRIHTGASISRRPGGRGILIAAILNLVAAGSLYYAIWWLADPFLYITMIKKTPIDVPADIGTAGFFVPRPPPTEIEAKPDSADAAPAGGAVGDSAGEVTPPWSTKTAQIMIPATAYAWLALTTIAAWAAALAAGAGFGAAAGGTARRPGAILAAALGIGLAYAAFAVWSKYGMAYKPDHLRFGMGGLVLFLGAIGLIAAKRLRGLTRLAGATVILAGAGSAAAMWLWAKCGALEAGQASVMKMALVFTVSLAWGWALWATARR